MAKISIFQLKKTDIHFGGVYIPIKKSLFQMLEKDWLGIIAVSRGSSGSAYECYA